MIFFVDFEASSLLSGSFPIEVAWVDTDGHGESYLIRPADKWLADGCSGWSQESEALHGISLDTLLRDGVPLDRVAARAAKTLSPGQVMACSDAPESDGYWMEMLLRAGGQRRTVKLLDVNRLYGWACRPLLDELVRLDGAERERGEERVRKRATKIVGLAQQADALRPRVVHRALADAESLWRTWRAVVDGVARQVAGQEGHVAEEPLFRATYKSHVVTIHHASAEELAALDRPLDPAAARDVLSAWSLVAIRRPSAGDVKVHALGWREAEANTWITSALVAVDLGSGVIGTSSGHAYRLGVQDGPAMAPDLRQHLAYALRKWGFTDVQG